MHEDSAQSLVPSNQILILCVILCFTSAIFSLIIPYMFYTQPKTRQYPAILLVIICIAEVVEVYHLSLIIMQDLGWFDLKINDWVLTKIFYPYVKFGKINGCNINMSFFFFSIFFQQGLYLALCLDIAVTLRKPFISVGKRLSIYIPILVTISLVLVILDKDLFINGCIESDQIQTIRQGEFQNMIYQDVFIIVSIITIILAVQGISSAKKSQNPLTKIKIVYLKHQIISQIIILITWSLPLIILTITNRVVFEVSLCAICSQGIFLGLLRIHDSIFRQELNLKFLGAFKKKQESVRFSNQEKYTPKEAWNIPLVSLLNTIQHQEVISAILDGILQGFKTSQKKTSIEDLTIDLKEIGVYQSRIINGPQDMEVTLQINREEEITTTLNRSENTINMKVIEYSPCVFQQLRHFDQIYNEEMLESFSVAKNQSQMEQLSESMGKSGAFFFKTHNQKFIIKTITESEQKFLMSKVLAKYTRYIMKNNKSLLARIYGCYQIRVKNVAPIYLILMENTFSRIIEPDYVYDIKGSILGRKSNSPNYGKDLDLLETDDVFIKMSSEWRSQMIEQAVQDTEFLQSLQIMDYSLLVGIKYHLVPPPLKIMYSTVRKMDKGIDNSFETLSLGIIDYLQEFDTLKFIEFKFKSLFNSEISSIKPEQYQQRFVKFINTIFIGIIEYD